MKAEEFIHLAKGMPVGNHPTVMVKESLDSGVVIL